MRAPSAAKGATSDHRCPKTVAVVPAWNARSRLPDVLGALEGQVERMVVVDNGSRDATVPWLDTRGQATELLTNATNLGFATAVNQGIRRALELGADAVLLVNDDAVFQCVA